MKCDILIVAGLWNSGPQHWQTHWERKYSKWERVAHRDWHAPDRDEWVAELDAAIAACDGRPILVAHSLGCMLVAQWAQWACSQGGSPLKIDINGDSGFGPWPEGERMLEEFCCTLQP
jgi:predicted alpha/beta hydrolase family esterase